MIKTSEMLVEWSDFLIIVPDVTHFGDIKLLRQTMCQSLVSFWEKALISIGGRMQLEKKLCYNINKVY